MQMHNDNGGSLSETSKKKKRKAAEQATLRIENGTQSEKDVTGTSEGMFMGGAFPVSLCRSGRHFDSSHSAVSRHQGAGPDDKSQQSNMGFS